MAAHESPRTTKLYDRTADVNTLDKVERIVIYGEALRRGSADALVLAYTTPQPARDAA